MLNLLPALAGIDTKHVRIERVQDLASLLVEVGRRSMMGYAGDVFFGTAFVQGNRLQFTTAMTIPKMIDISKIDRANKKDTFKLVTEHSNRPEEPAHGKQVRSYLLKTACAEQKFILPSFMFNYGVGLEDDAREATLMVFANDMDGATAWPAILMIPQGAKLDTTDGAHRRSQTESLLLDPKVSEEEKDALKRNAVSVTIVFEHERNASHQDFADCGKAKSITKSMVVAFDLRDAINNRTRDLVQNQPFLAEYVDATANNVNLSAKSTKVWSMSAIRMFVWHVAENHPDSKKDPQPSVAELTEGAEEFFAALVRHMPQLVALDEGRETTGVLREKLGGDIALRGVGLAIFARAFIHCIKRDMPYDEMASKLAEVNWSILIDCEKKKLKDDDEGTFLPSEKSPDYAAKVREHANKLWANLLTMTEGRAYRTSMRSTDIELCWKAMLRDDPFAEIEIVDAPKPEVELLDF